MVYRKHEVKNQEKSLEDLDARLREADDRLKKLEAKHKRMSQMWSPPKSARKQNVRHVFNNSTDETGSDDSGGYGEHKYGRTSPESEGEERRQ